MKILLSTRKGLITLSEGAGGGWRVEGCDFPGVAVENAFHDRRTGDTWASLQHGHWGPKLHRRPAGGDWQEVSAPAYAEDTGATLENVWVLAPGGDDQPDVVYAGTNPGGLFRSRDGGQSWQLVEGLWNHDSRPKWFGGGRESPGIHSVVVDPRDSRRILVGVSCGGVFESVDGGDSWAPRNKGVGAPFLPEPTPEVGQDPHSLVQCKGAPDTLWQQNHSGVFRSDDGGGSWEEVSEEGGPVYFGFPIAVHPARPQTAWVVPAKGDVDRAAFEERLMVCRTEDGGRSWTRLTRGLPDGASWDLVYRHALDIDGDRLVFGSTTGNVYVGHDGGEQWQSLGHHFPPVYAVHWAPTA